MLRFEHWLVFGAVIALITTPSAAYSLSVVAVTVTPPSFSNLNGDRIRWLAVGQQIIISTTFTYNEFDFQQDEQQRFVAIIQVRDQNGITQFLAYQSNVVDPGTNHTMGFSWLPEEPSTYQVRAFAISDLVNPQILTEVRESEIDVK